MRGQNTHWREGRLPKDDSTLSNSHFSVGATCLVNPVRKSSNRPLVIRSLLAGGDKTSERRSLLSVKRCEVFHLHDSDGGDGGNGGDGGDGVDEGDGGGKLVVNR